MIPSTKRVFDRYWKGDIAKNAFTGPTGVTRKEILDSSRKRYCHAFGEKSENRQI